MLHKAPPPDEPVREHLLHVMAHLRKLLRAYIYVSALAFPAGMLAGMALAWTELGTIPLAEVPTARLLRAAGIGLVVCALLTWPLQRLYHWILAKTYGKDIACWETALADLADEPLPAEVWPDEAA